MYRDVGEGVTLPPSVADVEWVFLREENDPTTGLGRLVDALQTDLAWRDQHTRLAGRTREWLDADRNSSYLLRGADLREAEAWLSRQEGHRVAPTPEQAEYIARSRQAAGRRQRALLAGVSVALVVAIGLAIVALIQRSAAISNQKAAQSEAATDSAEVELRAIQGSRSPMRSTRSSSGSRPRTIRFFGARWELISCEGCSPATVRLPRLPSILELQTYSPADRTTATSVSGTPRRCDRSVRSRRCPPSIRQATRTAQCACGTPGRCNR
jgi:hypothetical protein